MSFNALSLARLGIGFGVLAVASLGLLGGQEAQAIPGSKGIPGWYWDYEQQRHSALKRVVKPVTGAVTSATLPDSWQPENGVHVTYRTLAFIPPLHPKEIADLLISIRTSLQSSEDEMVIALLMEFIE